MSPSVIIVVTPPCMVCGASTELVIDRDAFTAWQNGALIQSAFPIMTPEQRELLKLGTHPTCWDEMFAGMEDGE